MYKNHFFLFLQFALIDNNEYKLSPEKFFLMVLRCINGYLNYTNIHLQYILY